MQLILKSLSIRNFMSFESASFMIDERGFVLISGKNNNPDDNSSSNGAGKSTIAEAISYALTGNTIRGSKDVARYGCSDPCEVQLEFRCNGEDYIIIRGKNPAKVKFYRNANDISGKGVRDTEKIIEEHLPDLDSGLLNSVILLGQGLPSKFTSNTPAGRKEVLETLTKSDYMIEDLKTRVSARLDTLNATITQLDRDLVRLNAKEEYAKNDLDGENKNLEILKGFDITTVTSEISEKKFKASELQETVKSLTQDIQSREDEKKNKISSYQNEISQLTQDRIDLRNKLEEELKPIKSRQTDKYIEINQLTSKIKNYDSVVDVCPTCGQKLVGVEKFDTTHLKEELAKLRGDYVRIAEESNEKEKEYNKLIQEKQNKSDVVKNNMLRDDAQFSQEINVLKSKLKTAEDTITSIKIAVERLTTTVTTHDDKIKETENKISTLTSELSELASQKLYIESEYNNFKNHLEVVNKFMTFIKRDFRGYLLQNVITYMNTTSKHYSELLFKTDKLDFTLDGNNISISYCQKEYESLSGGEKQKVDLCIQFALRDMLSQFLDFSCNVLFLDEITDNLDSEGCQNVIQLISKELNDIRSVFIISHRSDLNIPCDSEIVIIKNEQGISQCIAS